MKGIYCLFSALIPAVYAFEQQVLGGESNAGILRRFNVSDKHSAKEVIFMAQTHRLDIWAATQSYIDIYWPSNEPSVVPPDLEEIPHSTKSIPLFIGDQHRTTGETNWDLTSLENSTFHDTYHPLEETDEFMRQLTLQYPNITTLNRIGLTGEERDLYVLTISKHNHDVEEVEEAKDGKKKKKKVPTHPHHPKYNIIIVGAQHAREWIATAASLYLAHALVANETGPHSLSSLLEVFDFHIIPNPNPDGYVYSWDHSRYWYKNRQVLDSHVSCRGIDMNRNWGYKWHHEPVEGPLRPTHPVDPCSHWYPGSRPYESSEVNSIANYVTALPSVIGFLDLRSYGQMISTPYSYSCKRFPKDIEDLTESAYGAVQAIKSVHGAHFEAARVCENLYEAPGNILDWMYAHIGVKYSYSVHLRDTGTWGFSLPPKWIRPVGEETSGMVHYLAKFIAAKLHRKI